MRIFAVLHDRLTIAGNYLAMALLLLICLCFSYEVMARYLFNAPTLWSNSLVSYFLCAAIFLSVPNLTRRNEHVTIGLLTDAMKPEVRRPFEIVLRLAACFMCCFAAWFCASESIAQYTGDIETILEWPVPKWMVSGFIPYGFLSSGLYFLRHALTPPPPPEGEGIVA